ncbi:hypothetical protein CDAR_376121 [Caerostris darwini]|uniref:Uncharacterized protein n=1 Tax=Caerostris darwini TaxID=1538125 RepID=A0AAV4VH32_9ARAC|nr:hypothetical protein CDAR_376121 [Caerostris darwini]
MEVDDDGRVEAAGKSPSKDSCKVPVSPATVPSLMTTQARTSDMTNVLQTMAQKMNIKQVPVINKEALICQQLLQAEQEAAHQKTRYDAALGFVNVANIISDQDLLDKTMAARLTKETLAKAEADYRAALQRAAGPARREFVAKKVTQGVSLASVVQGTPPTPSPVSATENQRNHSLINNQLNSNTLNNFNPDAATKAIFVLNELSIFSPPWEDWIICTQHFLLLKILLKS